jgi:Fe-S cluster assembly protein SufD
MPIPTDALEEWRYSRIDSLDIDRYRLAEAPSAPPAQSDERLIVKALVEALGSGVTLIETHNGHVSQSHVSDRSVTIERLSAPDAQLPDIERTAVDVDAFSVMNRAFAPAPVRLKFARGQAASPVVIVHWVDGNDVAVFPQLTVELEEGGDASIVEMVAGPGRALVIPVTDLSVGAAARLSYLQIQLLGSQAWQLGLQTSRVDRDASLMSSAVALGGDYARLRTDSVLVGQGATGRLLALYFGAGTQMHDFRTVQDHRAPKTSSDLLYKGAVANSARSVYSGLIRVEKGARGTNAFQTNRNLVLHEGAHADSVPNLEIEENDVRCSHASAVGPIQEDQRFYLESRGVPQDISDRLIALGFLGEVLEHLPFPAFAVPLRGLLAAKLEVAEAVEATRSKVAR